MMKKTLTLLTCFLLGGCGSSFKVIEGPSPGTRYPHQLDSPFPWVSVIPSERALALREVSFEKINDQLRYDLSFQNNKVGSYGNVCLVLVDYAILPEGRTQKDGKDIIYCGEIYSKQDVPLPKRYFMHLSFYNRGRRPPEAPDFEEKISMPVTKSPAQEAMYLLVHEIFKDHEASPLRKLDVQLD